MGVDVEVLMWRPWPKIIVWLHCQARAAGEWTIEPRVASAVSAQAEILARYAAGVAGTSRAADAGARAGSDAGSGRTYEREFQV